MILPFPFDLRNPPRVPRFRSGWLGLGAAIFLGWASAGGVRAAASNVLLIIADDFGADSCSLYNSTGSGASLPPTPNLTALARRGVVFRNAYGNPLCSPTRCCVMTGRYAYRTGVGDVIEGPMDARLSTAEFTLPDAFASRPDHSFQLAQFGKWHLGGAANAPATLGAWPHFAGSIAGAIASYTNWTKVVNGTQTSGYTRYATTDVVDDALAWIQSRGTQPWFAWVAFNAGHTPFHKPPNSLHSYDALPGTVPSINSNPRAYFEAMVEAMDTEMGRLLSGVSTSNTHVIFLGDNGTSSQIIQPPYVSGRAKGTLYEGGTRVPLVVAGPSVVSPGRTNDTLVHAVDLYSTILELAGLAVSATVPASVALDSRSVVPMLEGGTDAGRRAYVELFNTNAPAAGDGRSLRNARYKLLRFLNGTEEFYDLAVDPTERTNLLTGPLTGVPLANYHSLVLGLGAYQDSLAAPVIRESRWIGPQSFSVRVQRPANVNCQLWRGWELNELAWSPVTNAATVIHTATEVTLTDTNAAGAGAVYRVLASP